MTNQQKFQMKKVIVVQRKNVKNTPDTIESEVRRQQKNRIAERNKRKTGGEREFMIRLDEEKEWVKSVDAKSEAIGEWFG